MSSLANFFLGTPAKAQALPSFTGGQESILNALLGGAGAQLPQAFGFLANILGQSPEAMQAFERPAIRQFEEQIIPSIAERFSAMDGQRSSAFQQALGGAGTDLAERLQAQRSGLGFQAVGGLESLLSPGLQPRFQYQTIPGQPGFLQSLLGSLGSLMGGLR